MKVFLIKEKISPKLLGLEKAGFYSFITKSQKPDSVIESDVKKIIEITKKSGDEALISYANQFDKTDFKTAKDFLVSEKEMLAAEKILNAEVKQALKMAYARIVAYHKKQLPKDFLFSVFSSDLITIFLFF